MTENMKKKKYGQGVNNFFLLKSTAGLVERAQEEPLPDQGGEDHASHHHQDDPYTGNQAIN